MNTRTINGVTEIIGQHSIKYYVHGTDTESRVPCLVEFMDLHHGFDPKYLTTAVAMFMNRAGNETLKPDMRLRP